ncbi:Kef-type K+ transport system membrane component KefB [Arthrobacter sp. UYEF21]
MITDLGWLGNRETRVVISILVFEDLTMAVYLPVLTSILAGASFLGGLTTVGIALAVVTVVLTLALRHGHRVSKIVHSENSEVFLVNILGAALLVAGVASAMLVSAAVGAFLLGIAISGATSHNATRIPARLRDLLPRSFLWRSGLTLILPPFRQCLAGRSSALLSPPPAKWPSVSGPPSVRALPATAVSVPERR